MTSYYWKLILMMTEYYGRENDDINDDMCEEEEIDEN